MDLDLAALTLKGIDATLNWTGDRFGTESVGLVTEWSNSVEAVPTQLSHTNLLPYKPWFPLRGKVICLTQNDATNLE